MENEQTKLKEITTYEIYNHDVNKQKLETFLIKYVFMTYKENICLHSFYIENLYILYFHFQYSTFLHKFIPVTIKKIKSRFHYLWYPIRYSLVLWLFDKKCRVWKVNVKYNTRIWIYETF